MLAEIARSYGYKENEDLILFPKWTEVKDEVLRPDRKNGSGNGTIHFYTENKDFFVDRFPNLENTDNSVQVNHYFFADNLKYIMFSSLFKDKQLNVTEEAISEIDEISNNGIIELHSNFRFSDDRPYFKKFSDKFKNNVRKYLLPSTKYKCFLFSKENNEQELGCFWFLTNEPVSAIEEAFQNQEGSIRVNQTVLSKPFILLAGISGTGKSRFVFEQAGAKEWKGIVNFELVAVRPDWHEPSDLLGYTLRMKETPEFISTPVLKFMVKAWLAALRSGVTLGETDQKIIATYSPETPPPPFWLCLDEMNLAPVEQYFADYLSIIETREWSNNQYRCKPILKAEVIQECKNIQKALGLDSEEEAAKTLWTHIEKHGLAIPFNLIVAGTVNMDETTHGFSRKVIDRALSFDFGEFAPNEFEDFFKPKNEKPEFKTLTYPTISQATLNNDDAQKTIEFLSKVNVVLKDTLFEIAYRALNECLLAVECEQPSGDDVRLQSVWDDFLMMKVLPRMEGDEDKLASPNTKHENLLVALEKVIESQLNEIWDSKRPDLLRDNAQDIECRSKTKIARMKALLENGFTSFWP